MIKSILVTGANGFIGCSLCVFLKQNGYIVREAVRDASCSEEYIQVGDVNGATDWQQALAGVDVVIHLAARVHVMHDTAENPLDAFRQVNVQGTEHLARMAAQAGVKRFIFISSVKVNGEGSDQPYTEKDIPKPEDAYGISKWEAEEVLARLATETGFQTVVLRLPLVYGPGVKANFRSLIRIAGAGLPLPLKGIENKRSFIYIGNVVDAIATCITHPLAVGETFLLSDGEDVSTPKLLEMVALAMNKKLFLFSLGQSFLKLLCNVMGKKQELEKLTGTLIVDSRKIRRVLGWTPPFALQEGIAKTILKE